METGDCPEVCADAKQTRPSHPLEAYGGDYTHPGYGKSSHSRWNTEFWYSDWRMTFAADVTGKIARVSIPFEPQTAPINFTRDTGAAGIVYETRDGLPFARK